MPRADGSNVDLGEAHRLHEELDDLWRRQEDCLEKIRLIDEVLYPNAHRRYLEAVEAVDRSGIRAAEARLAIEAKCRAELIDMETIENRRRRLYKATDLLASRVEALRSRGTLLRAQAAL